MKNWDHGEHYYTLLLSHKNYDYVAECSLSPVSVPSLRETESPQALNSVPNLRETESP